MSKHTPGPWKQRPEDLKFIATDEDIGGDIARVLWLGADCEANARLIAAAPDLLEAAKRVMAYASPDSKWADELEAAIAKAEGKA